LLLSLALHHPNHLVLSASPAPPPAGFYDYSLVFLRPSRPSRAMQRLLSVHAMSHRLKYLQGSATSHTVSLQLQQRCSHIDGALARIGWCPPAVYRMPCFMSIE
jgi:hypothetical protein